MQQQFPKVKEATIQDLSPSIHWAQEHQRNPATMQASRRIYDFELLFIQKGNVEYLLEDSAAPHLLRTGYLLLIPAGVRHEMFILEGENAQFLGIHFDFFDELAIGVDEEIIVKEAAVDLANFCALPDIAGIGGKLPVLFATPSPQIIALMEVIIHEFSQKHLGYELICKGAMLSIISLLYRGMEQTLEPVPTVYAAKLQDILDEIAEDCTADWSNPKLGQLLDVHEDYMARLFKNRIGMTPNKYVQWVRHQKAKQLLRENAMKVKQVGNSVGYQDIAYFCRVFKKYEGISPEQYRRYSQIL